MTELARYLSNLLGESGWLSGTDAASSSRDWLDRYGENPLGIARPASTGAVAAIVKACRQAGVSITPQGGNTSLCGAAVSGSEGSVILSLSRMARIGETDKAGGTITVDAGVVLASLHEHLEADDLIFPMHLGAEGSAQIGGPIATNAGGSNALRYGMMQDLIVGLEVVLADGSIWDGVRLVQKVNADVQLRRLFSGSEGTLGKVTRAILRVFPAPKVRIIALLASPNIQSLVAFGAQLRSNAGEFASGLEFIERAESLREGILPGVRISPFGHLGDGNIHYNLSPPETTGEFNNYSPQLATELGALATSMQGSFAAEHGLGRSKIGLAGTLRGHVERRLMSLVKQAFDPDNLLNPGVIVDMRS